MEIHWSESLFGSFTSFETRSLLCCTSPWKSLDDGSIIQPPCRHISSKKAPLSVKSFIHNTMLLSSFFTAPRRPLRPKIHNEDDSSQLQIINILKQALDVENLSLLSPLLQPRSLLRSRKRREHSRLWCKTSIKVTVGACALQLIAQKLFYWQLFNWVLRAATANRICVSVCANKTLNLI